MQSTQIFSQRLRELCAERSSNSQVARDLDINRQQFARYLNGSTMPRPDMLARIAGYFELNISDLFQIEPTQKNQDITDVSQFLFGGTQAELAADPISERDLAAGFYLRYKQMFTRPGYVLVQLMRIRHQGGQVLCEGSYSSKLRRDLPGIDMKEREHSTFIKLNGFLVSINIGARFGAMHICSYRTGTEYSNQIKPGMQMATGRSGAAGPVAGRTVLVQKPHDLGLLAFARRQGVVRQSEIDPQIRIRLDGPEEESADVIGLG